MSADHTPSIGLDPNQPQTGMLLEDWSIERSDVVSAKLAIFQKIYVDHPPHTALHGRWYGLMSLGRATQGQPQKGIRTIALTGSGKTAAASTFVRRMHPPGSAGYPPVAHVALEKATTSKRLIGSLLHWYGDRHTHSGTEARLKERLYACFERFGTQLLIIDEVQHLNHRSGDKGDVTDKAASSLSRFDFNTEYRSSKEDPASSFYRPCLLSSELYKRAVGYFRSTVYLVVGSSTIEFARRGGQIRLICSPELSAEDIDGIAAGYAKRDRLVGDRILAEIEHLLADEGTAYQTRVLATLITVGALDIKVALRADRKGIYHEKIGVFLDTNGNKVSFKGSANETWSGWHSQGNFESIEVFCSWRGGLETERVRKHETHFDALWSGTDPDVEVFAFPEKARDHLKKIAFAGGLSAVEATPIEKPSTKRTALAHQAAAIDAWAQRGHRGIFEHATGSGKTFTAILAIRDQAEAGRPAVVLVPSRLLLEQWADELRDEVPGATLLLAGGGHTRWRQSHRLHGMTADDPSLGGRIVLATMQTAATEAFRSQIVEGVHLLVVADEVHQIGSPHNSRFLEVDAGGRLGLSATPSPTSRVTSPRQSVGAGPVVARPTTWTSLAGAASLSLPWSGNAG